MDTRASLAHALTAAALLAGAATAQDGPPAPCGEFDRPDGLVTNEYAFFNPRAADARPSPVWEMTSGSLFASGGMAWSGVPDAEKPDAASAAGTDSAVFRLNTKRAFPGDVEVSFRLLNQGLVDTPRTPATDWDGVHVWLRYTSQTDLYALSVNRRDGTVAIKKKVTGGPSNGGTYYTLATAPYQVPYGRWQEVRAGARDNDDGSVDLRLWTGDHLVLEVVDNGRVGGAPLVGPGRVGIRADNCDFKFAGFTVSSP